MKHIDNQAAIKMCDEHMNSGHHIDSRLISEVRTGNIFLFTIDDLDTFLSLIWQARDDSRLLTPANRSRTLRDVATRFVKSRFSFPRLASNPPLDRHNHDPTWFKQCVPIAESFSYGRFGFVAVTPANDHERADSPTGTYYIFDGAHKTLVLSVLLLTGAVMFQTVTAILLIPRR